jgi:hypothetical protein
MFIEDYKIEINKDGSLLIYLKSIKPLIYNSKDYEDDLIISSKYITNKQILLAMFVEFIKNISGSNDKKMQVIVDSDYILFQINIKHMLINFDYIFEDKIIIKIETNKFITPISKKQKQQLQFFEMLIYGKFSNTFKSILEAVPSSIRVEKNYINIDQQMIAQLIFDLVLRMFNLKDLMHKYDYKNMILPKFLQTFFYDDIFANISNIELTSFFRCKNYFLTFKSNRTIYENSIFEYYEYHLKYIYLTLINCEESRYSVGPQKGNLCKSSGIKSKWLDINIEAQRSLFSFNPNLTSTAELTLVVTKYEYLQTAISGLNVEDEGHKTNILHRNFLRLVIGNNFSDKYVESLYYNIHSSLSPNFWNWFSDVGRLINFHSVYKNYYTQIKLKYELILRTWMRIMCDNQMLVLLHKYTKRLTHVNLSKKWEIKTNFTPEYIDFTFNLVIIDQKNIPRIGFIIKELNSSSIYPNFDIDVYVVTAKWIDKQIEIQKANNIKKSLREDVKKESSSCSLNFPFSFMRKSEPSDKSAVKKKDNMNLSPHHIEYKLSF